MTMSPSLSSLCCSLLLSGSTFLGMGAVALAHSPAELDIERLSRQLAERPDDVELLISRGELYRVEDAFAAAWQDLLAARRLAPERPDIELYSGLLMLDWGRPADAIGYFDRFFAHPRRDGTPPQVVSLAHAGRAKALLALGRPGQAGEEFSRAIAAREDAAPELYLARAEAILAAATTDDAVLQALAGLDDGIARLGPVISLENTAIELEMRLERHDRALERLDQAFAKVARRDLWLARRGELLQAAGRVDEARAAWTAALVAIESLPAARRMAPATIERRATLEKELARLGEEKR